MPNLTATNIDLARVALEVWNQLDATLSNDAGTEQTFQEGTLLARDPATGNLIPYAPAASPDRIVDVNVNVASIPANTAPDTAVAVAGSLVGDLITVQPLGVWDVGLGQPTGRCLVAGTVQMRTPNVTVGAIDPAAQDFRFQLQHPANFNGPKYVLTYAVTIGAASTARVSVLAAGKVRKRLLKVHGAPPTAANADHIDALGDRPILVIDETQLSKIDNPQS